MPWRPAEPLIERARQILAGTLTPAPTGDAATVILCRQGGAGLEVHLQRRAATMVFPGVHVFPGGRVDQADYLVPLELPRSWPARLGASPALAAALVVAACPETFEEAGVLLVEGPVPIVAAGARTGPFAGLGVTPSVRLIRPWARWVTPEFEPRRFDTRFFVAMLPSDQMTAGDDAGGEADAAMWMSPKDALAKHEAGELAMLPPTAFCLRDLADYPDPEAVIAAADARVIEPIQPRLVFEGDEPEFVVPDAGSTAP